MCQKGLTHVQLSINGSHYWEYFCYYYLNYPGLFVCSSETEIPWKARLGWAGLCGLLPVWKLYHMEDFTSLFFFCNLETHFLSTVVLKVILNWFSPIWFKHIPFVNLHVNILIVDIWLYLFQKFYIRCKKMWILRGKSNIRN